MQTQIRKIKLISVLLTLTIVFGALALVPMTVFAVPAEPVDASEPAVEPAANEPEMILDLRKVILFSAGMLSFLLALILLVIALVIRKRNKPSAPRQ